jgi:aspartate ammonia-lyase
MADFLQFSSTLKELAVELCKIASDLRLLASGPYAGFSEIKIPALLPERSDLAEFLPDKQNPYLTETVTMVCYQVIGNDAVATMCAQAGQLETNSMTPLLIHTILQSLKLLKHAVAPFNSRCLSGITADSKRCQQLLELSGASAAAVSVYLGAERAAEIFTVAKGSGKTVRELVIEQKLLTPDVVDRILHYKFLTRPSNVPIGGVGSGTTSNTNAPIDSA